MPATSVRLVSGEAVYYTRRRPGADRSDPEGPRDRIRYWGLDRVLSGDVITEQNIHALDVATWIIDQHPLQAYGTCGKKGRGDNGTCNGHFAVDLHLSQRRARELCLEAVRHGLRRHRLPHVRPGRDDRHPLRRHHPHRGREVLRGRPIRHYLRGRGGPEHRRLSTTT